jgi:hypothetical protein
MGTRASLEGEEKIISCSCQDLNPGHQAFALVDTNWAIYVLLSTVLFTNYTQLSINWGFFLSLYVV